MITLESYKKEILYRSSKEFRRPRSILSQFDWSRSALAATQIQEMQELLVESYDIFAKHRFDVGYNTELKVKLTPEHDLPAYVQSTNTNSFER